MSWSGVTSSFACIRRIASTERCLTPPSASGPLSSTTARGPRSRKSTAAAGLQVVAQIERGVDVLSGRLGEEAGVHALEGLGVAVVGALHGGATLWEGHTGHLHAAEAVA